ncbi:hypothetical protein ACIQGZ_28815 [Streptomyces sp. NPDC092296]|uniref:hypothetical protein n=1 Tax=Streptomyces sp. NPDC092296 TaxID=3366012 RepID=UPI0037F8A464
MPAPDPNPPTDFATVFAGRPAVPTRGRLPGARAWGAVAGAAAVTTGCVLAATALPGAGLAAGGQGRPPVPVAQVGGPVPVGPGAVAPAPTGGGQPTGTPQAPGGEPTAVSPTAPGSGDGGYGGGGGGPLLPPVPGAPVPQQGPPTATPTGRPSAPGHPSATAAAPTSTSTGKAPASRSTPEPPPATPKPPAATAAPPATPADRTVSYKAAAGYGCDNAGAAFRTEGSYSDGIQGWYRVDEGGLGKQGCGTGFWAVPMSGSSSTSDGSTRVIWSWQVGAASRTCAVQVYIPGGSTWRDAAGSPAHYEVLDTAQAATVRSTFTVDQPSHRGSWVQGAMVTPRGGTVALRLVNTGQDWKGDSETYAHLAAGQARVTCYTS